MARFNPNLGEWDDLTDIPHFWVADFPSWAALVFAVAVVIALRSRSRPSYIEFHREWTIADSGAELVVKGQISAISDAVYVDAGGRIRIAGRWVDLERRAVEAQVARRGVVTVTLVCTGKLPDAETVRAELWASVSDGTKKPAELDLKVVHV